MDVQRALYMNGGDGETSYAKNSSFQREIQEAARPVMREALIDLYHAAGFPGNKFTVADLGCSSGPNALTVVADVVDTVGEICRQLGRSLPEFQLFLNDLPGNDFNWVFRSLEAFYEERERGSTSATRRCFVAGVAGSFYGRLFPSRSIHLFHSSTSLQWLSQIPPELKQGHDHRLSLNKGSICISTRSPPPVVEAYSVQFQKDFSNFLKCRSEEIVGGGVMVLTLIGRKALDPTRNEVQFYYEILAQLLMDMAKEGCIKEEKVHSFNVPLYTPCVAELEGAIQSEGSFFLKRIELFEVAWETCLGHCHNGNHGQKLQQYHGLLPIEKMSSGGQSMSNCVRAILESMLEAHFGAEMLQDLFLRYSKVLEESLSRKKHAIPNIVMSLSRKAN